MEFLKKTLDILENVMLIVAELDPGQKPSISEDLGDLRLMRKQLSNECGGETNHKSAALPLHGVSVSKLELFANWLKEQKHEIRGGKKMYDVRYYRWLTEDEMYEYWSQRVYSR